MIPSSSGSFRFAWVSTMKNWRFIQDVCVRLSEHRDSQIRSNSLLGLSYAARFRGRVEKNVVKPVLLRGLKDPDPVVAATAQDAIDDINCLMGWRVGEAKRQKQVEARHERTETNERVGCKGGFVLLCHAARHWPALPQHERWPNRTR